MFRIIITTAILLSISVIIGCTEVAKDDPRFLADPAEVAIVNETGFAVPGAEEVDLVENMAGARGAYREALQKLADYYDTTGNAAKRRWASKELNAPRYRYLMPAQADVTGLAAIDSIVEADNLYKKAMKSYKKARDMLVVLDDDDYRDALSKFNKLIQQYPSSDKIDDAAFRAGKIYEHFGDYEIAAVYYQRAFQWDPKTPYTARFRAAYLLDQKLKMRKEALTLYQMAYESEMNSEAITDYTKRRILDLTTATDEDAIQDRVAP